MTTAIKTRNIDVSGPDAEALETLDSLYKFAEAKFGQEWHDELHLLINDSSVNFDGPGVPLYVSVAFPTEFVDEFEAWQDEQQ